MHLATGMPVAAGAQQMAVHEAGLLEELHPSAAISGHTLCGCAALRLAEVLMPDHHRPA
jgi:hypothetical protein